MLQSHSHWRSGEYRTVDKLYINKLSTSHANTRLSITEKRHTNAANVTTDSVMHLGCNNATLKCHVHSNTDHIIRDTAKNVLTDMMSRINWSDTNVELRWVEYGSTSAWQIIGHLFNGAKHIAFSTNHLADINEIMQNHDKEKHKNLKTAQTGNTSGLFNSSWFHTEIFWQMLCCNHVHNSQAILHGTFNSSNIILKSHNEGAGFKYNVT